MAKTQNFPIGNDFKAEVVQRNLEDLYEFAHTQYAQLLHLVLKDQLVMLFP
jgi:hypothetical protein